MPAGFVAGNLYHNFINPPEYKCNNAKGGGDCNTLFFFVFDGISGVSFGALLGMLFIVDDTWEPVQVTVSPHGGGRLALRYRFGG